MRVTGVLLLAAVLLGLAGCGSASVQSPPGGVDSLVIPTPAPDPDDFVAGVDNPWLPLEPGSSRTYAVSDTAGVHRLTVTIEDGPVVAGVSTTAQVSREQGHEVIDWFAQDTAGNVWWFGRKGVWQAGEDGAEAGIAMLAVPRVGDGYRRAYAPGVVEDTATVLSLDEVATVPAGSYVDLVVIEERSPLESAISGTVSYAPGVGPVEEVGAVGEYRTVRLLPVD